MEKKLNTKNYSKSPNTVVKPSSNCGINGHWQNHVSGGNQGRLQDDVYIWVCVRGFLEWAGERKTIALARSQDPQYQFRPLPAMVRARHECGSSAGWPQVPAKNTCGLRTRGSGSSYSHGSRRIRVTILDFRRYPQIPAGHPLPVHVHRIARYIY